MSDPATIDWWKLAELIGVWAAAWATFYAARVSLRIAGQQDEARLKVTVVAGLEGGNGNSFKDVVWITVTNVARRAVTIDYVGWRSSQFVKTRMLQKVDPPNATLPVKLLDGEKWSLILLVEKSGREGWYQMMAEQFFKALSAEHGIEKPKAVAVIDGDWRARRG